MDQLIVDPAHLRELTALMAAASAFTLGLYLRSVVLGMVLAVIAAPMAWLFYEDLLQLAAFAFCAALVYGLMTLWY